MARPQKNVIEYRIYEMTPDKPFLCLHGEEKATPTKCVSLSCAIRRKIKKSKKTTSFRWKNSRQNQEKVV